MSLAPFHNRNRDRGIDRSESGRNGGQTEPICNYRIVTGGGPLTDNQRIEWRSQSD